MAKDNLGKMLPHASVIEALDHKLSAPLDILQDFPDPLSLYSLYCIIAKSRKCNEKPDAHFRPFKAREYSEAHEAFGDYLFWVRTLEDLLGECLVYRMPDDMSKLTDFGTHMYPSLMNAFLSLYTHNDIFESLKDSWKTKSKKSIFNQFNP